jgi:hypothetical protein
MGIYLKPKIKCCIVLLFICGHVWAQEQEGDDAYYRPKKRNSWLTNNSQTKQSYWYVGLEGGVKWNDNKLDNNLSGYMTVQNITDAYWGSVLGFCYENKWMIESGYGQLPSNTRMLIRNLPTAFRWKALPPTIPLRFKQRLLKIGTVRKLSGLYATVGVVWQPLTKTRLGGFDLNGFTVVPNVRPVKFDTVQILNESFASGRPKLQLEAGVEFVGRVSKSFELVLTARANYASQSLIDSNTKLLINNKLQTESFVTVSPLSYQFGFGVRYLYSFKNEFKSRFEE